MTEIEQRRRAAAQTAWETARLTVDPKSVADTTRDTKLLADSYRQLSAERLWSALTEVIVDHRLCAADVLDETTRHAVAIVAVRSALHPNCPPDAAVHSGFIAFCLNGLKQIAVLLQASQRSNVFKAVA